MSKREILIRIPLEGEMLERFMKDVNTIGEGKFPQTMSRILEERYGIKDTIRRGYHHLRMSNAVGIRITKGNQIKEFETLQDAADFLMAAQSDISKISRGLRNYTYKGWKLERI